MLWHFKKKIAAPNEIVHILVEAANALRNENRLIPEEVLREYKSQPSEAVKAYQLVYSFLSFLFSRPFDIFNISPRYRVLARVGGDVSRFCN